MVAGGTVAKRTTYNTRYGAKVGQTTRYYPGYFRRPASGVIYQPTLFRRRYYSGRSLRRKIRLAAEHKNHTNLITKTVLDAVVPWVTPLTLVSPGFSDNQRIGDKIYGVSLQLKLRCYFNWDALTINDYLHGGRVRVAIAIWKDDTTPTYADFFDVPGGGGAADACSAFWSHDKMVKRKVLYDSTKHLKADGWYNNTVTQIFPLPGSTNELMWDIYIPFKKLKDELRTINFQGGTTTGVNNIYLIAVADANQAATEIGPTLSVNYRYNYTDA